VSDQLQLLKVQQHDTRLDQLERQRATLAQRSLIESVDQRLAQLDAEVAEVEGVRHGIERIQKRLEDDMATTEARITTEEGRLYQGNITSPKEAQALTEEIAGLKRRVGGLEEDVLTQLVEIEPHDERLAELSRDRAALDERRAEAQAELTVAEAEIDAEADAEKAARAAATEGIPGELLAEYERLRSLLGGVGVAKLEHKSCLGCHLQLSAMEYDRVIKEPTDAIVHCEECGRLLVR